MSKVRVAVGIALLILFAGCVAPIVARACTVSTYFSVSTKSGPPGSQVSVAGEAFQAAPVDVYWGKLGGPLLAQVSSVDFSGVAVVIPASATPGPYYIVATDHTGPIQSVSATFTVTPIPPSQSLPPQPSAQPSAQPGPQSTASAGVLPSVAPAVDAPAASATTDVSGAAIATADAGFATAPEEAGIPSRELAPQSRGHQDESVTPVQANRSTQPGFPQVNHDGAVPTWPPAPVALGLVLAGVTVLGAASLGGVVVLRRRRALAAASRNATVGTEVDRLH